MAQRIDHEEGKGRVSWGWPPHGAYVECVVHENSQRRSFARVIDHCLHRCYLCPQENKCTSGTERMALADRRRLSMTYLINQMLLLLQVFKNKSREGHVCDKDLAYWA